ncbi:MAG: glycosyltransferase family 1 protein [bacterium]
MARIAIDARFYGGQHTGLGRYTTNILKYLPNHLKKHKLHILLRAEYFDRFKLPNNCIPVLAEIPHYSLAEQLRLPSLLSSLSPDLLYTFHFNTPVLVRVPTIVTVHDLIKSHFTGADTTTRSPWLYSLKRLGYNRVIKYTLEKARDIIVPTNTVKNDILALFPTVKPELVHPIPEAPDEIFRPPLASDISHLTSKLNLPSKFILFVGNAYPHKNLSLLLKAMQQLPGYELVIVAKSSPFLSRVLAPFDQIRIHVLSGLSDAELFAVYRQAKVLVSPSLMEGYGLVGLESLMVGTPVVASNIPVYREVYGGKVTYFDPHSVNDLVNIIASAKYKIPNTKFKFSRTWDDVAHDIAEVINARMPSL